MTPIPPRPTANTDGRNSSASASTPPTPAITASRFASPAITISSDPTARGTADGKRRRQRSAARSPRREAGEIEIWGDGEQTRSFLYVDECLEGTLRLMRSDCTRRTQCGLRRDGLHQCPRGDDRRCRGQDCSPQAHSRASRRQGAGIPTNVLSPKSSAGVLASRSSAASRRPIPGLPRRSRRQGSAAAYQLRTPVGRALRLSYLRDFLRVFPRPRFSRNTRSSSANPRSEGNAGAPIKGPLRCVDVGPTLFRVVFRQGEMNNLGA